MIIGKVHPFPTDPQISSIAPYDAATEPGPKGALPRREGLHHSHIIEWRKARDAGALNALAAKPSSPKTRKSEAERSTSGGGCRRRRPSGSWPRPKPRWKSWESARALGATLRERGQRRAAQEVIDEAFAALEPVLGVTTACAVSGKSRATVHRHPPFRASDARSSPGADTASGGIELG
ncbi:hypothetical protein [Nonomuraea angiospora]